MNLFFAPLACSMATRIALYEAGAQADYTEVDTDLKQLIDGSDFLPINPLGQVPALRTDDGVLLTENTAILPYVADAYPQAQLAPAAGMGTDRARLHQWLGFVSTELHKAIFVPLLDPDAPQEVKRYALEKLETRIGMLNKHLANQDHLLDRFSVADAYLFTVLNWAQYSGVALSSWPHVDAYYGQLKQRPSVAQALGEEMALYMQASKRRKTAASQTESA
ncbi:glutathione S-transferase [Pandoraea thiooxydans]|uniref:Glutathione S-transferase n=1 Tax=Pandoraea thiooxydans TaxID=445709 RepID=A0A0G3EQB8_9BURK|nr:glutathione binding-like protein [Pandoraea thiooxydans]AKJ67497.1 glutathione S-transferase [Pandoraea thiooxydans]APR94552.1 glutathione S-transferase [Pandoraea thiooxydans]